MPWVSSNSSSRHRGENPLIEDSTGVSRVSSSPLGVAFSHCYPKRKKKAGQQKYKEIEGSAASVYKQVYNKNGHMINTKE